MIAGLPNGGKSAKELALAQVQYISLGLQLPEATVMEGAFNDMRGSVSFSFSPTGACITLLVSSDPPNNSELLFLTL